MSYTEERLKINEKWIQSESGHGVAYFGLPDMDEANARRLVACWNACDGMPQDDVEELAKMPNGVMNLTVYADDLLKERDELVKALRLWMHFFGGDHEDAIMTIAEDGSTLTEPQEVTARILARYQERKS